MKHLITLLILGGAIFLPPSYSRANPYTLSCSLVDPNQMGKPVSRAPKRPLVVDVENHVMTLPSRVIGYTLILEGEDGEVFTYIVSGTVMAIPQELIGIYTVTIFNNSSMYKGAIFV